jgi:hypothetical protein
MMDPMLSRLVGCFVFAGLLGALIVAVAVPQPQKSSDVVSQVEMQRRVASYQFTRP